MQEHGIMLYKLGHDFTKSKVIILCQQTMKRKPLKVSLRVRVGRGRLQTRKIRLRLFRKGFAV